MPLPPPHQTGKGPAFVIGGGNGGEKLAHGRMEQPIGGREIPDDPPMVATVQRLTKAPVNVLEVRSRNTKNVRLRRVRTINAGQSITVPLEPDSSLAWDDEDWLDRHRVWEKLHVRVQTAGTLSYTGLAGILIFSHEVAPAFLIGATLPLCDDAFQVTLRGSRNESCHSK